MVVDIGGGTVDITVHNRRDGKIAVIIPPIGNACGGTTVNDDLSLLIEHLVQDKGYVKFLKSKETAQADLNKMFYQDFEEQKKKFGEKYADTRSLREASITLPRSFTSCYGDRKIKKVQNN